METFRNIVVSFLPSGLIAVRIFWAYTISHYGKLQLRETGEYDASSIVQIGRLSVNTCNKERVFSKHLISRTCMTCLIHYHQLQCAVKRNACFQKWLLNTFFQKHESQLWEHLDQGMLILCVHAWQTAYHLLCNYCLLFPILTMIMTFHVTIQSKKGTNELKRDSY